MSADEHLVTEPVKSFPGAFAGDLRSEDGCSDVNVAAFEHDASAREAADEVTGLENRRRCFLASEVSSWRRFLNVLIHGERPVEGRSTPVPIGGTTAGSMSMRGSPLFESLFADCQGSVMAIRCAALSMQDSSLTDFKMERRGEFPAFMNYLQGFPHGRLQELYEQCDPREAAQMPKIIAEVAQAHIERFLSTIHDLLVERDRFRALREIDALLRWYRNWLCPCIDEYAAGNEFMTNSLRKAVIPPQRREMQSMLTEAYRFYLLRMYQSTVFAHMIAYEARNLAALRSLFGLGWSQIKDIEETAAAEVWRHAIDEALTADSESEVRARRAGASFNLPLHEPSTRKRLREMRRFLVAVLGEERAASALASAAKPIVEEEAIRTLVSRRFPDDIEIQRLCILAASLDCDVLDAIRRAGEKLGIGQSTRVKVLVHVASKRMNADISSLSLRL
ncbi:hypothetical protein CCYA_CCYA19G4681 [Cyanidiococcus yangmingshanensis]|nr:hypothetical protein CCYA_CCYA19G4681 [Cyanidiococcus yangmingshanensis]